MAQQGEDLARTSKIESSRCDIERVPVFVHMKLLAVDVLALALLQSAFGAPAEARALAQSHHGCGSAGRFALMQHHIDRKYEAWAWAQVKAAGSQADGCNNCALEPVHARATRDGMRVRARARAPQRTLTRRARSLTYGTLTVRRVLSS